MRRGNTRGTGRSWRMRFGDRRRRVWLLMLLNIGLWGLCFWFEMFHKDAFLDDTFIYLHIANNVLESGTARYFPIADHPTLPASSPLRLLVLVPATLVTRL